MKLFRRVILGVLLLIGFTIIGSVIWFSIPAAPMTEALSATISSETIEVTVGELLIFEPKNSKATIGYIFYPGARVDYRAYAPYAHAIAEQGYLVAIPKMPLNLAVLGINKAKVIIDAYPEISNWVIGGHSLGGSMAANALAENPARYAGLIFLASYPASSDDLFGYPGLVTSIYGSLDGLATLDKISASVPLLPKSTIWVQIEGGNHANFGWYGNQSGDNPAAISRMRQQDMTTQATMDLLKMIGDL